MLDINTLWEKAKNDSARITPSEIQALINDRLSFVTDNLSTVSVQNKNETLFDVMMLFFDGLSEKRKAVLDLYNSCALNSSLICQAQAQIITAIDHWHNELNLHWTIGRYVQNLFFLCALIYAANVWKDDTSADNSKVMAKIDELIRWINSSKSAPFDLMEKIKSTVMGA